MPYSVCEYSGGELQENYHVIVVLSSHGVKLSATLPYGAVLRPEHVHSFLIILPTSKSKLTIILLFYYDALNILFCVFAVITWSLNKK